jgi:hypothetical protein
MCVGLAVPAEAVPVTIEFTGNVEWIVPNPPGDPFGGGIVEGTSFSGSYTFESTSNDQDADPRTRRCSACSSTRL